MRTRRPFVPAVLGVLVLCGTGCSGSRGGEEPSGSTTGASTASSSPTSATSSTPEGPGSSGTSSGSSGPGSSPPVEDPTTSGSSPPGSPRTRTVRGTVSEGVEAGCLVLTPDDATATGTWVLVGRTRGLRPGDTVRLRGSLVESGATTCNEGPPFRVEEVLSP